jgi:mannose/fructose/sorbose-specific phosphotransferase system IIA component
VINVVLVSHGDLGAQLIRSAEMIAGECEGVFSVSLYPGETPEQFESKLQKVLEPITSQETIILMDIFSGTPYNVASRQILKDNVECITGANLPMLIELLMMREGIQLSELAVNITQAGQDSVKNLKPLFRGN